MAFLMGTEVLKEKKEKAKSDKIKQQLTIYYENFLFL